MASDRLELRRIEFAAQKVRSRPIFDVLTEDPAMPFLRFDGNLTLAGWNVPAARLFGYTSGEGPGLDLELLLAESQRGRFRALIEKAVADGGIEALDLPPEMIGLRQDGTVFLFEFGLSFRVVGSQSLLAMALRDIS